LLPLLKALWVYNQAGLASRGIKMKSAHTQDSFALQRRHLRQSALAFYFASALLLAAGLGTLLATLLNALDGRWLNATVLGLGSLLLFVASWLCNYICQACNEDLSWLP
jgi:hypothetical protein